ncbi:hypothetical protein TEA_012147 [Camellia sinensis var. sinensis]|uniref:Arginyl-tRNA synthetase catalytic core domain-containing protein n=1 Tax=Camellia sinensis var. sinensis TaxID=542762 RepID=A0A4S4DPM2_CAMSN|nr:hypothetical protein TEA_012147 [Camellia sinensis var. sinensis]
MAVCLRSVLLFLWLSLVAGIQAGSCSCFKGLLIPVSTFPEYATLCGCYAAFAVFWFFLFGFCSLLWAVPGFGMLIEFLFEKFPNVVVVNDQAIGDLKAFYKASKQRFDSDLEFKERAQQAVVSLRVKHLPLCLKDL